MKKPLDDAEVVRVAALADVPTLHAWLELAHARAGAYVAKVTMEPVPVLEFDIAVPVGAEPLIVNNAGRVSIHHADEGKMVGVLLRFTLGAADKPPSLVEAIAAEREACALDASYPCRCDMPWGDGYRATGHTAECFIRNDIAARIRART